MRGTVRRSRFSCPVTATLVVVLTLALMTFSHAFAAERLVYMYNWYNEEPLEPLFQELIAEFKAQHPEIDLEIIRGTGAAASYDQLTALIASGNPPDVVHFDGSAVVQWWLMDALYPLNDLLKSEVAWDAFLPFAINEATFGGKVWGLPFFTAARGLYWNQSLFAEAGLDPDRAPDSIDELDQYSIKLTRTGNDGAIERAGFVPWSGNWYLPAWFWAFGGSLYDPQTFTPTIDHPRNVDALEWLQSYVVRWGHAELSARAAPTSFFNQELAMTAMHSFFINDLRTHAPDVTFQTGAVPHTPEGRNGTWAGGQVHIVPRAAENLSAAAKLLTYLASTEVQLKIYEMTGRLPTHGEAVSIIAERVSDQERHLLNQLPVANSRPPLWQDVLVNAGLIPAQTAVLTGAKSPIEALSDVQRVIVPKYAELRERAGME